MRPYVERILILGQMVLPKGIFQTFDGMVRSRERIGWRDEQMQELLKLTVLYYGDKVANSTRENSLLPEESLPSKELSLV